MKPNFETIKVKAGIGMVRKLTTLAPNTLPQFIGHDFVDGQFIKTDKVEEILVNRNNKHYYKLMLKEGALIQVKE